MRSRLYVLAAISLMTGCIFILLPQIVNRESQPLQLPSKNPEQHDAIDEAMRQEIEKTMDVTTGEVPAEKLILARQVQEQRFAEQAAGRQYAAVPGINWTERGPKNVAGRTRGLLFDASDASGKKVWAGGVGGGIWYCNDITAGTPAWTKINDLAPNLAVTTIAQDPFNYNIMYFGTGEGWLNADAIRGYGIYKSVNGGATWDSIPSTANNPVFYYVQEIRIVCCDQATGNMVILASTRDHGVQRSADNGASWSKCLGAGAGGGAIDAAADLEPIYNYVFATLGLLFEGGGGIYRSDDAGETWETIYIAAADEQRIEIAPAPNAYWQIWALVQDTSRGIKKIMKTSKGNYPPAEAQASWVDKNLPPWCDAGFASTDFTRRQAWYDLIAAVDPLDTNIVYIGGVDLHKTIDGGGAWTQLSQWGPGCNKPYVHADIHEILFRPCSGFPCVYNELIIATDGGIFRTTDGGASFTERNNTYNVTQYYSCAIHPSNTNYFLAGSQDNGTQRYNAAGINSTFMISGGDGGFCHIDQDNPLYQFTSYTRNNYNVTADGGGTFFSYNFSGGSFINPTDYDNAANILYGGNVVGSFFRWQSPFTFTTDSVFFIPEFVLGNVTHVYVSPLTANRVYFGLSNGSVVRVDNAGTTPVGTIIKPSLSPAGSISGIAVDPTNENHMLISFSNYNNTSSVMESMNANTGAPTWQSREGNLPDMPVRWIMFDPRNNDWAIIATELGVWSTDNLDASTNWQPTNNNFARTRVDMLQYRAADGTLAAATHGRGLFTTVIPGGSPLPVSLIDFSGKLKDHEVWLEWKTAHEQNSKGFEIGRSYNGVHFKKIGFVAALGNSNVIRTYGFHDADIAQPANYYRLKMVDDDGGFKYSEVILVKDLRAVNADIKVLNNPFSNHIDVQFGNVVAATADIRLIDAGGRLIMRRSVDMAQLSRIRIKTDEYRVAKGVYTLQVIAGNKKYVVKMMKE